MWDAIGWLGNAFFFGRFLLQWRAAEQARHVVAPPLFWWFSISGSCCLLIYTASRSEAVLFAGALVNAAIYARNIYWAQAPDRVRALSRAASSSIALICLAVLITGVGWQLLWHPTVTETEGPHRMWVVIVFVGQVLWSSRFLIQWLDLEHRQRSHLPRAFWWVSLAGNLALLSYVLHLRDAVLIAGYAVGPVVQLRNIVLGDPKSKDVSPESEAKPKHD
ncbi:MAG: lipid-A-disaccharide synthase-like uncharacterized protein [Planctomycetota bacterium]|jgi:lipid-A-disaccharide synthase-like uncharacterized protein